jgi:hypothetical protein
MSAAIESALQTVLQGLTQFDGHPEGVTRGDYRVLDSGLTHTVIIEPGTFISDDAMAYTIQRTWDIPVLIFEKYIDDAVSLVNFTAFRDAVIARLDQYPTLNGAADLTLNRLSSDGDPEEVKDKQDGGPFFTMQTLRVSITERVALSGGEYN